MRHLIFFLLLFLPFTSVFGSNEKPVRMKLGYANELTIGTHLPAFPYDGRAGISMGTIADEGNGLASVYFSAENTVVPPLLMFPPFSFARVEIYPNDLVGWIDFCSGEAELDFDARFVPMVFGIAMPELSVVTGLTTGISTGQSKQLEGVPMNGFGDINLVGVAQVPKTDDPVVDWLLQLPNDAATDMLAHWDFPQGKFPCPTGNSDQPPSVKLTIDPGAKLKISRWPTFKYDALGASVEAVVNWQSSSLVHVSFPADQINIPPLKLLGTKVPGGIGVLIETHGLQGTIDVCSGEVLLDFDATFTPYLFGRIWDTGVQVRTQLTTDNEQHGSPLLTASEIDEWGDGYLAGVAQVPMSEDDIINRFLRLPSEALAELPAHIDVTGIEADCAEPGML